MLLNFKLRKLNWLEYRFILPITIIKTCRQLFLFARAKIKSSKKVKRLDLKARDIILSALLNEDLYKIIAFQL